MRCSKSRRELFITVLLCFLTYKKTICGFHIGWSRRPWRAAGPQGVGLTYCQLHKRKSFLNRSPGRDFGAELGTKAEWGLGEEITTGAEPNAAGLCRLTLVPFPSSFPSLGPWAWVEGAGMVWSWGEPQKTLLLWSWWGRPSVFGKCSVRWGLPMFGRFINSASFSQPPSYIEKLLVCVFIKPSNFFYMHLVPTFL